MLKLSFWILLAANIVLFVFQQTYFDAPSPGKREPERLSYQYRESDVRLVSQQEINRELAKLKITEQDITTTGSCMEVGTFNPSDANRFKQQIVSLSLEKNDIETVPVYENNTYMVFIPPLANQQKAQAKIEELKTKGIESYYLIKDQSQLKWAISLGVFKTQEAAKNQALELQKQGVDDLQIIPRGTKIEKVTFRLNHLNDAQLRALEPILKNFPHQTTKPCTSTQSD